MPDDATRSHAADCAHGKDYPCRWPRCAEDGVCQDVAVSPFPRYGTSESEICGDTAIEVVELLVKDALMRGQITTNTARQVMYGLVGGVASTHGLNPVSVEAIRQHEDGERRAHATPDRAAKLEGQLSEAIETRERLAEALWRLWRSGYVELDDLRAVGCGDQADAMERAASGG